MGVPAELNHLAALSRDATKPAPKAATAPTPKGGDPKKAYNGAPKSATARRGGTSAPPAIPVAARKIQNPSYVDALHFISTYFQHEAELATLFSNAARNGFDAFAIRTSKEYNQKSTPLAFQLFNVALSFVPAASSLVGYLQELKTGANTAKLLSEAKSVQKLTKRSETIPQRLRQGGNAGKAAMRAERAAAHSAQVEANVAKAGKNIGHIEGKMEDAESAEHTEKSYGGVNETKDGIGELGEVGEANEDQTEEKEMGDFKIETVNNLTDLAATALKGRWKNQEMIDNLMLALEYSDAQFNLRNIVEKTLGKLPDPSSLNTQLAAAATNFEIQLYLDHYVEAGAVTYVTTNFDDSITHKYDGLPDAVVDRFLQLGLEELLLSHPKLRRENVEKHWTSQKF